MELTMTNSFGFCELNEQEMMMVDGGGIAEGVITFAGGVNTTLGAIALWNGVGTAAQIGSTAITGAFLATPAGWAMIGCCVVGGIATGILTAKALKS
ncbi:MAG: hypothetical protein LUI05_01180 [Oscillospiraceae bacterium]|nr:hypothetical protein [Oscillospiraceae bacterium]